MGTQFSLRPFCKELMTAAHAGEKAPMTAAHAGCLAVDAAVKRGQCPEAPFMTTTLKWDFGTPLLNPDAFDAFDAAKCENMRWAAAPKWAAAAFDADKAKDADRLPPRGAAPLAKATEEDFASADALLARHFFHFRPRLTTAPAGTTKAWTEEDFKQAWADQFAMFDCHKKLFTAAAAAHKSADSSQFKFAEFWRQEMLDREAKMKPEMQFANLLTIMQENNESTTAAARLVASSEDWCDFRRQLLRSMQENNESTTAAARLAASSEQAFRVASDADKAACHQEQTHEDHHQEMIQAMEDCDLAAAEELKKEETSEAQHKALADAHKALADACMAASVLPSVAACEAAVEAKEKAAAADEAAQTASMAANQLKDALEAAVDKLDAVQATMKMMKMKMMSAAPSARRQLFTDAA